MKENNRTIIVTGASRGIGSALLDYYSTLNNTTIIAISRNAKALKEAEKDLNANNTRIIGIPFDLNSGDYKNDLLPKIMNISKSIDIVINNAGLLVNKPFSNLSSDDFDAMFNTNVKSVFLLSQALLPMMSKGSHIVNISSMGGFQGSAKFPGLSLYSASKGALSILTECMAEEFSDKAIKANCLAIGAVQTEMLNEAFPGYEAPVKPDEMAKFIGEFSLNSHQFINGKVIPVSLSTP